MLQIFRVACLGKPKWGAAGRGPEGEGQPERAGGQEVGTRGGPVARGDDGDSASRGVDGHPVAEGFDGVPGASV